MTYKELDMESSNKEENIPERRKRISVARTPLFKHAFNAVKKDIQPRKNCITDRNATDCENGGFSSTKDKTDCTSPLETKCDRNSAKLNENTQTDFPRGNVERQSYYKDCDRRFQNQLNSQFVDSRNCSKEYKSQPNSHFKGFVRPEWERSFCGEDEQNLRRNQKGDAFEKYHREYKTKSFNDHRKEHWERSYPSGGGPEKYEKWERGDRNRLESNNYRAENFCSKDELHTLEGRATAKFCDKDISTESKDYRWGKKDYKDQNFVKAISTESKDYRWEKKDYKDQNFVKAISTESKDYRWEKKDYKDQHFVKVTKMPSLSDDESGNTANNCEPCEIKHQRKVSHVDEGFRISIQNDGQFSSSVVDVSEQSDSELTADNQKDYENKSSVLEEHINIQSILLLDKENFIPPPVVPSDTICSVICDSSTKDDNNNGCFLDPRNSDSANTSTYESEADCSSIPELETEHLEAVTDYIVGIVEEKSVSNTLADNVKTDLIRIFRYHFKGNKIDIYGSYYSDLAITTSDINLAMISETSVKKSFIQEVHKVLSDELKRYYVLPYEEGISSTRTKIHFTEPVHGICCQLAYLGSRHQSRMFQMGKFFRTICKPGSKVKTLILAAKIWAEICLINEHEEGKLHPVCFALMMVHFLQQYKTPLLPLYSNQGDFEKTETTLPPCEASIGELWINFLFYYSHKFDWKHNVVTVKSKEYISKNSKGWETYWIAVEDPFSDKNIADSVENSDVADYIKECFKASYDYFSTPPEGGITDSGNVESFSNENICGRWQYAFHLCTVNNSDAFCNACEELEDTCEECKKKIYIPPTPTFPEMTDNFLKKIRKALVEMFDKHVLTDAEVDERKCFVSSLEKEVQKIYPGAEMKLFGSSANGFGFKNSDLDICMTFKGQEKVNAVAVLRTLRSRLRRIKGFDRVFIISGAQIPIIKFHYEPKRWRGDISINNVLAVYNSDLLYTYSKIDQRCKILCCALKILAKKALIAEVTEKALSSYSYLIMVIHFLQQTDPPVLPVLQDPQLHKDSYQLSDIVENWNVWFCKDLKYVERVYKGIYSNKNETPVEQLWLDLLDFYCSYESNRIVTIRQKEPMYLKENQHSARLFNIQDPFIETKNLGSVVSDKKAKEAGSVLRRARHLFRTPVNEFHASIKGAEDYFFSTMSLTGRIQKESQCNLCGKFGHEDEDCKQSYFLNKKNLFKKLPPRKPFRYGYNVYRKQINRHLQR